MPPYSCRFCQARPYEIGRLSWQGCNGGRFSWYCTWDCRERLQRESSHERSSSTAYWTMGPAARWIVGRLVDVDVVEVGGVAGSRASQTFVGKGEVGIQGTVVGDQVVERESNGCHGRVGACLDACVLAFLPPCSSRSGLGGLIGRRRGNGRCRRSLRV